MSARFSRYSFPTFDNFVGSNVTFVIKLNGHLHQGMQFLHESNPPIIHAGELESDV